MFYCSRQVGSAARSVQFRAGSGFVRETRTLGAHDSSWGRALRSPWGATKLEIRVQIKQRKKRDDDHSLVRSYGLKVQACLEHDLPACFWHPVERWLWELPEFNALRYRTSFNLPDVRCV